MNTRRRARTFALQALYAVDLAGHDDGAAALSSLWDARLEGDDFDVDPVEPEEAELATRIVSGVQAEHIDLDTRIERVSHNWRLARMPLVDRNILRVGAWELVHRRDVPASVAINEAIELAKLLGGTDTRSFVNGVLDRIANELGRGKKTAGKG